MLNGLFPRRNRTGLQGLPTDSYTNIPMPPTGVEDTWKWISGWTGILSANTSYVAETSKVYVTRKTLYKKSDLAGTPITYESLEVTKQQAMARPWSRKTGRRLWTVMLRSKVIKLP